VSEATVCRAVGRPRRSRKKKVHRGSGTRRVLEGTLAHGGWEPRSWVPGIRRRGRHPHLPGSCVCLRAHRSESVLRDPEEPGQEHHAAHEHRSRRDGAVAGRGRGDHFPSVRELLREALASPSALEPGQVVAMDNLGAHRPKKIRELIEGRGCQLFYLPSYSPDLNPIEEAPSKIKYILRRKPALAPRRP
jgi:hypothetical protein